MAADDRFTVTANGPPTNLLVLTNDFPSSGLRISQLNPVRTIAGTPTIAFNGLSILYTPNPYAYGTDIFFYTVTNSSGHSDSATVTVNVYARPTVEILSPYDGQQDGAGTNLTITGAAQDFGGSITNVSLFLNGLILVGQTNNSAFSFSWVTNTPGFYQFVAVAYDSNGMTNASTPVTVAVTNASTATNVLTANISDLPTGVSGVGSPKYTVVQAGLFDLTGAAQDSNTGDSVSYQVLLHPQGDPFTIIANVTPPPLNSSGFHSGSVSSDLGICDFTSIQNGVYDLELIVRGGGGEATVTQTFQLDSQLKIGQFSFSEQDLILPVNGIPITVTRTYNSLNPISSDFGYSWSFAINSMDVQLQDEERENIQLGGDTFNTTSGGGGNGSISVRSGGGRDVTLTLPDGRRVTYAFTPYGPGSDFRAYATWTAPAGVTAKLDILNVTGSSDEIDVLIGLPPYWHDALLGSTFDNSDVPGWTLTTIDGTRYNITRGAAKHITYEDPNNPGLPLQALVYGTPMLTSIVQTNGSTIVINTNSIYHKDNTTTNRTVNFARDSQGRITGIYDPNTGTNGSPLVQYVYDQDNGNLLQVIKLVDANAKTFTTNRYDYNNPSFPHFITSIENADGVPVARNFYDGSGKLTAVEDADGNLTQFVHNLTNNVEIVVDRLGHTNSYGYDLNGNVIAQTNALGQITQMGYDGNNNKTNQTLFLNGSAYATSSYAYDLANNLPLVSVDALGRSNVFTYNAIGEVTNSVDARGYGTTNTYDSSGNLTSTTDSLGDVTTNSYYGDGLLESSVDALGTVAMNYYDANENLTSTATMDTNGVILSTNSFTYDANGNRTNSTVWRHVPGNTNWVGATTTYIYDAQNRLVQTIDASGGTNTVVYNAIGKQQATIDANGNTTTYFYDYQGRLTNTTYPDLTTEGAAYDAAGNRTNSMDRLGQATTYVYDALNRVTNTIYADGSTNATVYDGVGRVQYSIDARGTTNAFGYDAAGQQLAVTNGFGASVSNVMTYQYDLNGNRTVMTDGLNHSTTNVYDALNRAVAILFQDGTTQVSVYDKLGRKIAQTDQAANTTLFGYDALGRLTSVTNALNKVTTYGYDEAGNQTNQVDALFRTNTYAFDALGRRIRHSLPGTQSETFGYDALGNLRYQTNFNGVVITNQYDVMNRLTNRASSGGLLAAFTYTTNGLRQTMTDPSGLTTYVYDNRDRLRTNATPQGTLSYGYDANGNVTNIATSTGGTLVTYQYDALNRLTNVVDGRLVGTENTAYGFDAVGNLQKIQYPNGATNFYQYDSLNRLTNLVWGTNGTTIASFYYQLGPTGTRTTLQEYVSGANRTNRWTYDPLYRLTLEAITTNSTLCSLGYTFDDVGNRLTRSVTNFSVPASLTNQTFTFNTNDWLATDGYDANGNTTNSTTTNYQYDVENRLTNACNGAVVIVYNGDGQRVSKTTTTGGTTLYLVDTHNPTGYAQVLEEFSVSGTTNLTRAYTYGMDLISQRLIGMSTNFFGHDGHGSVRFLMSTNAIITDTFTYDAYGTLISSTGTTPTHYLYCGEQFDSDLGFYFLRARYLNPNTGRFWTMDTSEGNQEDPLSLHKYLYCQGNPVNGRDPSGHEDLSSIVTTMGAIGRVAGMTYSAVSGAYLSASIALAPVAQATINTIFWVDAITTTVGAAAVVLPEVLNLAADLGTRINRAYSMNTTAIPSAPGRGSGGQLGYGLTIENIGGQQLQAAGGKYFGVGNNVKGIDGTLGVQGNVIVSFKAHNLTDDGLLTAIKRDMSSLQALDPEAIKGSTPGGTPFQFEGAASGRIVVIGVPQTQASLIISPAFIEELQQLAEETKTIPIVRAVRGWAGR